MFFGLFAHLQKPELFGFTINAQRPSVNGVLRLHGFFASHERAFFELPDLSCFC